MINRECGNYKKTYSSDMALYPVPLQRYTIIAVIIIFYVLFPLLANEYALNLASLIGIACISAIGLNILTGYTGQISVGHAAFMMVGAYTAAILNSRYGVSFVFCIPAAGIMAALPAGVEPPADLNLYYRFRARDAAQGMKLYRHLNTLTAVEIAFPDHRGGDWVDPWDIPPPTPDFWPRQGYQSAAPNGIDTRVSRVIPGGRGEQGHLLSRCLQRFYHPLPVELEDGGIGEQGNAGITAEVKIPLKLVYNAVADDNRAAPGRFQFNDVFCWVFFSARHLIRLFISFISSPNCSGYNDCIPSERAWGGSWCTSTSRPSAPTAMAPFDREIT